MASNRRGMTLIESLAAGLVLAVATGGLFAAWSVGMAAIDGAREMDVATAVARGAVERAKIQGWAALRPVTGAVVAYGTETVDGTVLRTAVWTEPTLHFGNTGAPLAANAPVALRRFSMVRTISDIGIQRSPDNSVYVVAPNGRRRIVARVTDSRSGEVLLTFGTVMARGGV